MVEVILRSGLFAFLYFRSDAIMLAQLEQKGHAQPSRPRMLSPWMETQQPCCNEGGNEVVRSSRDLWPAHAKAWHPVPILLDAFPDRDNGNVHMQLARNQTFDINEEASLSFKVSYNIDGQSEPYTEQCKKEGGLQVDNPGITFFLTCPVPPHVSEVLSNGHAIEAVLHKTSQPHDGDTWVPPRLSHHTVEYPPIRVWHNHPGHKRSQQPFLTACTIARADETASVKHWTSYMHLVGVDHVFVYMVEREESSYDTYFSDLGSARFITLVPWPFSPGGYNARLSQVGAYDNCMWRQKRRATWTLQAQHDEYIQPLGTYRNLKELLHHHGNHSCVTALETGWFKLSSIGLRTGPNGLEAVETPEARRLYGDEGPADGLNVFSEEFSYRAAAPFGVQVCEGGAASNTCKAFRAGNNFMHFFARPDDVVQTGVHAVVEFVNDSVVRGYFDPFNEARINHFSGYAGDRYKHEINIEIDCQGGRENVPQSRAAFLKDSSMFVMRTCVEMLWSYGHFTPEVEACVSRNWQRSKTDRIVMYRNVSGDSLFERGASVVCESFQFE